MLGAGLSSRMGNWKLLLDFHGKSIIEQSIENAAKYTNRILLAGGYRFDELNKHLSKRKKLILIENLDYKNGMLTSVKEAIKHVETEKFFIALGDMPLIPPEVFLKMSRVAFSHVLFPVCDGRRGHPVLLDINLKKTILNSPDEVRMKDILMPYPTKELEVESMGIFQDIDTASEYKMMLNNEIN